MRLQRSFTQLGFLFSIFREHYISSRRFKDSCRFRNKIIPRRRLYIFAPFDHIAFELDRHIMFYTLEVQWPARFIEI